MNHKKFSLFIVLILAVFSSGCVTKKKRNETSKFGKFYHNTTSLYNGYWNAKEIYRLSLEQMRLANEDDFNKILEVEDYISINDPKMVKDDMEIIIQKVTTVAQLHEPGNYVDDCYVMMGKAQYLKHDYETSEQTLEYFQEEFNPANPYGRNYMTKKPTGKSAIKAKALEREQKIEQQKEEREEKAKEKKEVAKTKAQERKEKQKQREREKKERERQRKQDAKNRKKGIKTTPKPKVEPEKTVIQTPKPEPAIQAPKPEPTEEEPVQVTPKVVPIDRSAYPEGLLWLAKTYIKRQNYFGCDVLLRKIDLDKIDENLKSDISATYASLLIKEEKYAEAIPKLEEAITTSKDKNLKGRYAFIAGQLAQQLQDQTAAYAFFEQSKKLTKSDRMAFMADMAIIKSALLSGLKSREQVADEMQKFLKNERYQNYRDQIYYTLAEMEMAQNNTDKAIENFKLSALNNKGNQKLKAETYLNIANLYYKDEKYLNASNYYDTTLTNLNAKDARQLEVKKSVEALKDIAYNISTITYNDTLLYFASLKEGEQKDAIKAWLVRNNPKLLTSTATTDDAKKDPTALQSIPINTQSSFFAYNSKNREKGIQDFRRTWGDRPLSDDWRRSRKSVGADISQSTAPDTKVDESTGEESSPLNDEYKRMLREIPSNPVKRQEIHDKIISAMYTLGKLFRDKIQNYSKSAMTLEDMHKRYGPTQYEIDSHYYLYLDYLDMNDQNKANEYKEKIIRKYPDSKYASVLSDPNYFAKNKETTPEAFYQSLYRLFENNEYKRVIKAIDDNATSQENSPFLSKISLLRAMCIGSTQGKDAYMEELKKVTQSFPNTPEQAKAREIMRYLSGDNSIFNTVDIKDVDKIYTKDDADPHYVAIVTYGLTEVENANVRVAISNYNKQNFKVENLQIGEKVTLNIQDKVDVILIKKFDNYEKADAYYKNVSNNIPDYTGRNDVSFDILPISVSNYRKMLSEKSTLKYRAFLEHYYK